LDYFGNAHDPSQINDEERNGNTPLHMAAEKGNRNTVISLIGLGVDMEARNQEGNTPLHLAAREG
jgi:ankyrin repeat protein